VNLLNAWMDPRHIQTHAFAALRRGARAPLHVALLAGPAAQGQDRHPLRQLVHRPDRQPGRAKKTKAADLDQSIEEINRFEQMLADEGALVLKFWFHLSKDAQKKRLKALEKDKDTRWRVTPTTGSTSGSTTSSAPSPSTCCATPAPAMRRGSSWRAPTSATARSPWPDLLEAPAQAASRGSKKGAADAPSSARRPPRRHRFARPAQLPRHEAGPDQEEVRQGAGEVPGRLACCARIPKFKERSLMLVFEGMDAAGKGGSIRASPGPSTRASTRSCRLPRPPTRSAPSPICGASGGTCRGSASVTIFDRSWYGRVLVERVEGFAPEADWMRAYAEINDFEDQLVSAGGIVVKFWLSISRRGAAQALQGAREDPLQALQDHRRGLAQPQEKWPITSTPVCDMIDRTSTENRALDPGRGQRQAFRPHQGPEDSAHAGRGKARRPAGRHEWAQAAAGAEYFRPHVVIMS
jgi:polyphosphate kinase 2 (PPK2 family)